MNSTNHPARELVEGDIVRVKDPSRFIVSFGKKIADRDAVVLWVGPRAHGMFKDQVKVRFLQRNGRGAEFEEVMHKKDLVLKDSKQ